MNYPKFVSIQYSRLVVHGLKFPFSCDLGRPSWLSHSLRFFSRFPACALVDHGVMTGVQKFIKVQADLSVTDGQLVVLIIGATPESVTLVAG